jgi:hypothetical protein
MKGGASAERNSSDLEERGDVVAGSGCHGARHIGGLAPSPPPADSSEEPLDGEEGSRERSRDVLSDLVVSTYSYSGE